MERYINIILSTTDIDLITKALKLLLNYYEDHLEPEDFQQEVNKIKELMEYLS